MLLLFILPPFSLIPEKKVMLNFIVIEHHFL
jgi:hypothetical protein